ncbi:hypothetical protein NMY22_g6513 [Coprinellus aureogranulatus]|nr:hypothetical protein NMY22_g6513 [Coprinellus aureogranulatus]
MSDEELKLVTTAALTKLFATEAPILGSGSETAGGSDGTNSGKAGSSTANASHYGAKPVPPSRLTPLSSLELLTHVMTTKIPSGLLPNNKPNPRFRLTDLAKFESILEDLARTWEAGRISYSREKGDGEAGPGTMTIWEVQLGLKAFALTAPVGGNAFDGFERGGLGKRKRIVDEDADSASGGDVGDDDDDIYREDIGSSAGTSQIVGVGAEFEAVAGESGAGTEGRAISSLGSLSKELREVYSLVQRGTAKGRLLAEQVCNLWRLSFGLLIMSL